jgi:hypothetical protein
MQCIIRIVDGQPFEHPIVMENFYTAFPHIDVNNLPPEFAKFERLSPPAALDGQGPYHIMAHHYAFDAAFDSWKDEWYLVDMTEEERAVKLAQGIADITATIAHLRTISETSLAEATDENKPTWQTYLDQLNALSLDDPFNVTLPTFPEIPNTPT